MAGANLAPCPARKNHPLLGAKNKLQGANADDASDCSRPPPASRSIALAGSRAGAQTQRTVKIIVPYTPASGPDILSRMMADQIGRAGGPTVVVENRPGGGTVVGTEAAARAAPDGNTVLLVANSFAIIPALKRGSYDVATSFDPVCYLASTPMVLVVQASSPYKTLADLIADARAKPGKVVFSSGGPASSLHVAIEVLAARRQDRDHLRALWRHRARDQRADGRPRHHGLGRLSDGGRPLEGGHAARRSSPPPASACRRCPTCRR